MRSPTVKHHHSHHFFARVFDPAPLTMTRPGAADSAGKQPDLDIDPASTATIIDEARELLRTIGRTCWVVFDRLDEAFYESPQLEMMALRELLQVIRDFSSAPDAEIKVKAFLRNDIFQRLSGSNTRLVNMTHILKTQITWPKDVLIDLICRRMAECPEFMEEFGFTADDLENGRKRHYMLSALLPAQVPSGFRHWSGSDTFDWIVTGTAFGGAQYSPRNVLAFLEIARRRQMQWQAINRDVKGGSILSPTSLAHAAAGVSQLRYDDTLLVEFHNLDAHVAKLRGGPAEYESYDALVHRLGLAQDERASKSVIDELLTSGVIESLPNQRVGVARLYRPALETEADLGGRKSRGA